MRAKGLVSGGLLSAVVQPHVAREGHRFCPELPGDAHIDILGLDAIRSLALGLASIWYPWSWFECAVPSKSLRSEERRVGKECPV